MSGKGASSPNGKGTPRRHPGVKGRRPDLKELRCAEANERTLAWQHLTAAEQLAELDRRLGKGKGAAKQRLRLAKSGAQ